MKERQVMSGRRQGFIYGQTSRDDLKWREGSCYISVWTRASTLRVKFLSKMVMIFVCIVCKCDSMEELCILWRNVKQMHIYILKMDIWTYVKLYITYIKPVFKSFYSRGLCLNLEHCIWIAYGSRQYEIDYVFVVLKLGVHNPIHIEYHRHP